MDAVKRKPDPTMATLLRFLEVVALGGMIFCGIAILHGLTTIPLVQLVVFGGWFLIAIECAHAMRKGKVWGAYVLATATIIVTLVEIIGGTASPGGAALGILIATMVIAYVRAE